MPIVMNVGPSAISAAGASGGGGQTLGNAQGSITINVHNVTQANKILQQSAAQMSQAFGNTGKSAQQAAQVQIAASRVAAANAVAASRQQIAANKIQASSFATSTALHTNLTKQQISSNRLAASSASTTAAQNISVSKQQVQTARQSFLQQSNAAKLFSSQQKQQHQTQIQGIQQQVAANRLIVSGISAQNAAARQAAQQQKAAAQASLTGWQKFHTGLKDIRVEILAIGASAGLISKFGFQAAGSIQESRIQLTGMTGSLEEATFLMSELQKRGRQAGVPFRDMLNFSVQLLPILEGNSEELLEWFDIVRRTAVLNRAPGVGGVSGATFSLREAFLSVQQGGRDFVSLADRFNISKKALQEALDISGGDFIKGMDIVLDRMGITTELADQMALSFNAGLTLARDAAFQLAAEGFGPLIEVIGPVLRGSADFLGVVRGGVPGTLALASGLVVVTTGGSALLLVVNQLTLAWTRMGLSAHTAISRMGRISAVLGGAVLGAELGRHVGISIGGRIRESRGQEPLTQEQISQNVNNILFNAIASIAKAGQDVSLALAGAREAIWQAVADIFRSLASLNDQLSKISPTAGLRDYFESLAESEREFAFELENTLVRDREKMNSDFIAMWESVTKIGRGLGVEGLGDPSVDIARREKFSLDKRRDAIIEWAEDIERIESDTNRERIKSAIDYGRRVNDINFQYTQSLVREAEDFVRSRIRQEQQYIRDILRLQEESARSEQEWREDLADSISDMTDDFARKQQENQEDHDEKIEDIRKDSSEKLLELEKDYQKDREKSLLDHRDKLLEAAANLDAKGIFEEQRRFFREQQEKEEEHKEKIGKEKKNEKERIEEENKNFDKRARRDREEFDRRLKQEQESFDKRLQEAREADDRRLFDMHEAFEIQRQEEDEDRAIRQARAAQDHARELEQLQLSHDEKMAEINRQEFEKLESLRKDHQEELEKLGFFNEAKDKLEEDFFQRSLKRHEEYFKNWETREEAAMRRERASRQGGNAIPSEFQSGGLVRQTGFAKVHAGEYVINPHMVGILRDMLNGGFTQASMMTPFREGISNSGGATFNGNVSISIEGSTNMGRDQMYSIARRAFSDALVELSDQ